MNEIRMSEYKFWSALLGMDAVRFSVYDDHGQEYYCIRPFDGNGKSLREMREHYAMKLYDAVSSGKPPGEIA